jgi:hypothetical protein
MVFKARAMIIQKQVCHVASAVACVTDVEIDAKRISVHDGSCLG